MTSKLNLAVLSLVAGLVVAGCQHPFLYQPRVAADEPGYESWQESGSVYFVRFTGEAGTSQVQLRDLALLRAAELARAEGYAEFAVVRERAWTKPTFRRGTQAPPESPIASQPFAGEVTRDQLDTRQRARSMIGDGPPVRVDIPFIELKLDSKIDATRRAQRPGDIYVVATLLRELPPKYGIELAATR